MIRTRFLPTPLRGDEPTGNSFIRFVVEEDRLPAVVDPFAIENTEELEGFTRRLIAEAIEERHRRGLSRPVPVEEGQQPCPEVCRVNPTLYRRTGPLTVTHRAFHFH